MEFRLWLVCLLLAMAAVASEGYPLHHTSIGDGFYAREPELMDSEINSRLLAANRRFISYNAMKGNSVPCSRRGQSYYNCRKMKKANPYKRGCSAITRCKRFTD
ncbi:protein RALF-like 4 [Rhodamnia argentea]|uniref:Protein RALF-like 4 n=1 Tax=Rhodamnia argentea TaxID=178133 RepID=A0A8B8N875_9MYRT|nr:protein RALF-like 4 [Rhodamnia argentea]